MISLPYLNPNLTDPLLRVLLAATKEAVCAAGTDGQVLAVNQQFLELARWKGEYSGQPVEQLVDSWSKQVSNPEGLKRYFLQTQSGPCDGESKELQPNAGQIIEARCVHAVGTGGTPYRLWLFQEWRNSALAWVSHEIRNPLNAVLGFSELLSEALSDPPPSEAVETSLRGLKIGTKHLQSVMGDLLDLSRLDSGAIKMHPEWVDLKAFLGEFDALFRTRARSRGLEFLVEAPDCEGLELWFDPARLSQVLTNLLSNSLRYTKRGWMALRVLHHDDAWEFVVEDSGVGIPVDQQKNIFDPPIQRPVAKQGASSVGMGLGLAISRNLAHGLGARVGLRSDPGHGSRFSVTFANLRSRAAGGACNESFVDQTPVGLRILVADDEKTNHLLLRGFLRELGATLLEASDGLQAVEIWKAKRPQVILMDLRMPGLSGIEAARRIRALDPLGSTKLLAMSATIPSQAERIDGRPLWSGYVQKPFSKQDILKFLAKHLTIVDALAKSS